MIMVCVPFQPLLYSRGRARAARQKHISLHGTYQYDVGNCSEFLQLEQPSSNLSAAALGVPQLLVEGLQGLRAAGNGGVRWTADTVPLRNLKHTHEVQSAFAI